LLEVGTNAFSLPTATPVLSQSKNRQYNWRTILGFHSLHLASNDRVIISEIQKENVFALTEQGLRKDVTLSIPSHKNHRLNGGVLRASRINLIINLNQKISLLAGRRRIASRQLGQNQLGTPLQIVYSLADLLVRVYARAAQRQQSNQNSRQRSRADPCEDKNADVQTWISISHRKIIQEDRKDKKSKDAAGLSRRQALFHRSNRTAQATGRA